MTEPTHGRAVLMAFIDNGLMGQDPDTVLSLIELANYVKDDDMDADCLPDDAMSLLATLDAERRAHAEYQARVESDRSAYLRRVRELEAEVERLREFSGLLKLDNDFLATRRAS